MRYEKGEEGAVLRVERIAGGGITRSGGRGTPFLLSLWPASVPTAWRVIVLIKASSPDYHLNINLRTAPKRRKLKKNNKIHSTHNFTFQSPGKKKK